jgi:transcriptional regulator with XRE-family HTH domain
VDVELESIKILSVGERLRQERKKLKLGQDDLAGDKFSKNYISMFENNRRGINRRNAEYLAQRINELSAEKGLESYIEAEYFLKSKAELAKECCESKIEKLKSDFMIDNERCKEIYRVWKLSNDYGLLDNLGEIHYIKGLDAYRTRRYRCAVTNTQASINYYNRANLLNKSVCSYELLGDICFDREYYEEAIIYYNLGLSLSKSTEAKKDRLIEEKLEKSYTRKKIYSKSNDNKSCI